MKTILTTGLLCVVIGATVGWMTASDHYEAKALKEQAAYSETLVEVGQRAWDYQKISEEYYVNYQDAISREPTVVTERVFVRADCKTDASTDSGGSVGNAEAGQRAEVQDLTLGLDIVMCIEPITFKLNKREWYENDNENNETNLAKDSTYTGFSA